MVTRVQKWGDSQGLQLTGAVSGQRSVCSAVRLRPGHPPPGVAVLQRGNAAGVRHAPLDERSRTWGVPGRVGDDRRGDGRPEPRRRGCRRLRGILGHGSRVTPAARGGGSRACGPAREVGRETDEMRTALRPHAFTGRESLARTRRLAHRPARFRQPRPGLPSAAARSSGSRGPIFRQPRPDLPAAAAAEDRAGGRRPRHRCRASVCRWRYRQRDFQRYRWKSRQRLRPLSTMPPPAGRLR